MSEKIKHVKDKYFSRRKIQKVTKRKHAIINVQIIKTNTNIKIIIQ